jgi:hypothetical protein
MFMLSGFSWKRGISYFCYLRSIVITSRDMLFRICLKELPTGLNQNHRSLDNLAFSVPTSQHIEVQEY